MNRIRLAIFLLALSLCGLLTHSWAKPGGSPKTYGPYDVVFAGRYSGEGRAVVAAHGVVHIKGNVVDTETGNSGKFTAGKMDMEDGRFEGEAVVMGVTVKVIGRVEPPDGALIKRARMTCTFCEVVNGQPVARKSGRIFGSR